MGICQGLLEGRGYKPYLKVLLGRQTTHQLLQNNKLDNSSMVMVNNKTYSPSSYVGSPRFTRMEKTACTTFSNGEHYPTTKEVQLLLTLLLASVVVTGYRSSTQPCIGRRTRKRTLGTSSRRGCRWMTWSTTEALLLSTRTSWIVGRMTCLSTILPCTI